MVTGPHIKVRLPVLRAEIGWTQRELAHKAGMRPDTVSALERGEATGIRFETMIKLCETLGCQPGDLFELDEGDGHHVPVLGGRDEDALLLKRINDPGVRVDGPTFLQELMRRHGGRQ